MKKSKLIMSVATLCLALAVLCFGVYAVQTVNYSLSGNITYEVTDAFVEVQTKVYKSTNYLTSAQLGQKVNEIAEASVTTAPAGLTLVDTSALANSTSGTLDPYSKTDLSFSTQAGSECYAYFFVTNIKNMSSNINVWAVMQDDLTNPTNTVQINNGCQQTIDTNGKNIVIGVGIDNPGNPIPSGTSSAFSYGMKIGVGDLATQDFNLAKLDINGSTVKANRSNMNGVVVIPDTNPETGDEIRDIYFDDSNYSTIIIPNTITFLEDSAFYGCTSLTSITIPSNLTNISYAVFNDCSELVSITVDTENPTYKSENNCLIETDTKALRLGCKSSIIPDYITCIDAGAFYGCSGLSSITIPSSVTSIEEYAFWGCTGLTSITIPSSVTNIGERAFNGCTGLQNEDSANDLIYIKTTDNNYFALYDTKTTTLSSCTINSNCKFILDNAFNGCTGLTEVTIPSNVISIGQQAFYGCTGLTSISIPNSVACTGYGIFEGWTSSQTIKVPFADEASKPSGWVDNWKGSSCNAIIEYTPAA